jgi:uncharacterized membrane protein
MEHDSLLLRQAQGNSSSNVAALLMALSAVGSGAVAGLMFAFSIFIMRALGSISTPTGIASMQAININIITPAFFVLFFGTAATSVAVLALKPDRFSIAAAVLYLVGVILITAAVNVPLNNGLADIKSSEFDTSRAADIWQRYLKIWTLFNHVRMVSAFAAAALFIVSLAK